MSKKHKARLGELAKEIARVVDALTKVGVSDALEEDIELTRDALSKLLGRITLTVDADGPSGLTSKTEQPGYLPVPGCLRL